MKITPAERRRRFATIVIQARTLNEEITAWAKADPASEELEYASGHTGELLVLVEQYAQKLHEQSTPEREVAAR